MKNAFLLLPLIFIIACKTDGGTKNAIPGKYDAASDTYLSDDATNKMEVFRVLMSAEKYAVSQKSYSESIFRTQDESGDKFFMSEISNLNKVDDIREGVVQVWLYPDTGKLMQVRFTQSTYIRELDAVIVEDIQRWSFGFKNKSRIDPIKFDVHYKIVLEKKLSDEQIMEEMRQSYKERTGQ